jgi:hypothetical protein
MSTPTFSKKGEFFYKVLSSIICIFDNIIINFKTDFYIIRIIIQNFNDFI